MADVHMLFVDALAQAIAEGRKTVTRRPITRRNSARVSFFQGDGLGGFDDLDWDAHQIMPNPWTPSEGRPTPPRGCTPCGPQCVRDYCCTMVDGDPLHEGGYLHVPGKLETRQRVFCRHKPGDTLIVRECWAMVWGQETKCECPTPCCAEHGDRIEYRAETGAAAPGGWENERPENRLNEWRPSIHMPRWTARSVRPIVSIMPDLVGVEQLTQGEAEREGFASPEEFEMTWAKIYGPKPVWSWRYEFEGPTA